MKKTTKKERKKRRGAPTSPPPPMSPSLSLRGVLASIRMRFQSKMMGAAMTIAIVVLFALMMVVDIDDDGSARMDTGTILTDHHVIAHDRLTNKKGQEGSNENCGLPPPLPSSSSDDLLSSHVARVGEGEYVNKDNSGINNEARNSRANGIDDDGQEQNDHDKDKNNEQCKLYLAESSIPNAGLGVYTSVPLAPGTQIGSDLVLPFVDMGTEEERDTLYSQSLWQDYTWLGIEMLPFDSHQADTLNVGLGAHINCHLGLVNVELGRPEVGPPPTTNAALNREKKKTTMMHRSKDPGIGAFSNYHSMYMKVTSDGGEIEAGSELFVNYGEGWFLGREEKIGVIPLEDDFLEADEIIHDALQKSTNAQHTHASSCDSDSAAAAAAADDINGLKTTKKVLEQDAWERIRNQTTSERVRMALPTNAAEVKRAFEMGGTARYSLPNFIRSPRWLQENGWCIDTLYPDVSAVPQAGRGAFARHFMPKDSVIMTSPVLHIGRDALRPYEYGIGRRGSGVERRVKSEQIIWNYSFGHENSSVLLLPYAPVVNFINHDGVEANAKIRWFSQQHDSDDGAGNGTSSSFSFHHSEWLNISSDELINGKAGAGLVIEYVALRDIKPNEEIFIDYGRRWEDAWKRHIANWKSPSPSIHPPLSSNAYYYKSASDIVRERGKHNAILTMNEQMDDPYPSNVYTGCLYADSFYNRYKFSTPKGDNVLTHETSWDDVEDGADAESWHAGCFRACQILSKYRITTNGSNNTDDDDDSVLYNYTAVMMNAPIELNDQSSDECHLPPREKHIISNIPRDAIQLADMPYSTDQHLPNVFRHELGVPLDFFPSEWMDLEQQQQQQD